MGRMVTGILMTMARRDGGHTAAKQADLVEILHLLLPSVGPQLGA